MRVLAVVLEAGNGMWSMLGELRQYLIDQNNDVLLSVIPVSDLIMRRSLVDNFDVLFVSSLAVGAKLRSAKIKHRNTLIHFGIDKSWDKEDSEGFNYPDLTDEFQVLLMNYKGISSCLQQQVDHLSRFGFDSTYLKPGISCEYWQPQVTNPIIESDQIVIGAAGNSRDVRDGYADFLVPVLHNLWEEDGGEQRFDLQTAFKNMPTYRVRNKMRDFYKEIDVFVSLHSACDLPRSAMEAAACGVPIIGTNTGVIPHLVAGNAGITIVRDHNEIEKVLRLFQGNKELRRGAIKAVRENVQSFDWSLVSTQWTEFFYSGYSA